MWDISELWPRLFSRTKLESTVASAVFAMVYSLWRDTINSLARLFKVLTLIEYKSLVLPPASGKPERIIMIFCPITVWTRCENKIQSHTLNNSLRNYMINPNIPTISFMNDMAHGPTSGHPAHCPIVATFSIENKRHFCDFCHFSLETCHFQ